jgi:hypothetical protein
MSVPAKALTARRPTLSLRVLPAVLVIVAVVPVTTVTAAAFAFEQARAAADAGRLDEAIAAVDIAVSVDPAFALYRRERAVLHLRGGDTGSAIDDARAAVERNPLDDTSFRVLALILLQDGRDREALDAAELATDLQATDPANQAVLAHVAFASGEADVGDGALRDLLAVAPWTSADPVWTDAFPGEDPAVVLGRAAEAVADHPPLDSLDARWVAILAGRASSPSTAFTPAQSIFALVMTCQPADAVAVSGVATSVDRALDPYLGFAETVAAQLAGIPIEDGATHETGGSPSGVALGDQLSDEARYARRTPVPWNEIVLPTDDGGRSAWLADPGRALAQTRGSGCR